jgi:F-type H+-transporting ATPase subunit epsilon
MKLLLEIVTPEGVTLKTSADSVTLLTAIGELTILPGHRPLAAMVEPGLLRYSFQNTENSLAVDSGFLFIQRDHVAVIVDQSVNVVDINVDEVKEAHRRAQEALDHAKKEKADPDEIARLEAKIRYQVIKQSAKKSR